MDAHKTKCAWALASALEENYHDVEWGVPVHDDRLLFEMLTLEGAQAGLSWLTILKKRAAYQAAFDNFDVHAIARYDEDKINALMANPGIVRHRLKINSVVSNARAVLKVLDSYESFNDYLWLFIDDMPQPYVWQTAADIPSSTRVSEIMSRDLKKRGFKFVGSTICYAFMQATGMVNDHTTDCFRHELLTTKSG